MFKLTHFSIFFAICLINIVHCQLIIKPLESALFRDQFKPFIGLCTGQGNTRVVTWQSPSQVEIKENNNARITVERKSYGLRLRIRNLTRNDQGVWTCIGLDQDGRSILNSLEINVKIPITFIGESIQYAELDTAILIQCRVEANPLAEISWFKGVDKNNILSSDYEQKKDGLRINRVSLSDNDIFWCRADVIETGESKDYPIQVILAQTIRSPRITCLTPCAVEKRTATLICEANGIPPPQYSWFYEQNTPIITNGISKFVVRGNRLIINYVDGTDNGRYLCRAFNDYDQKGQQVEYILNVIIPPHVLPIPAIEIYLDENLTSKQAVFICRVERGSTEGLSLEWLDANKTLVQPSDSISIDLTHLKIHRSIELRFDPVRREHHGNYTCVVKNQAETVSTIAQLSVEYKPVFIGPNISDVFSVPNYRAIMKCQFDSYPTPIIQWVKMNRMVRGSDDGYVILEGNDPLIIDILTRQIGSTFYETQLTYKPTDEDFGLDFQCRAGNPRIEKHAIHLRRAVPPQKPRITEANPYTHEIELNCQPPSDWGGLPLLQYIVKYVKDDDPNSVETLFFPVEPVESQRIIIGSLQASILYRIELAVESHAGQSAFSLPVQLTTLAGEVVRFNFTSSELLCQNDKSCLIKWIIQSDGGSTISRAQISYAKVRAPDKIDKLNKPIEIEPLAGEYEVTGLKPKTSYLIVVRLFNAAGVSERKIQIMTNETHSKSLRRPPKWAIAAIIVGLILGTIFVFFIIFLIRSRAERNEPQNPNPHPLLEDDNS